MPRWLYHSPEMGQEPNLLEDCLQAHTYVRAHPEISHCVHSYDHEISELTKRLPLPAQSGQTNSSVILRTWKCFHAVDKVGLLQSAPRRRWLDSRLLNFVESIHAPAWQKQLSMEHQSDSSLELTNHFDQQLETFSSWNCGSCFLDHSREAVRSRCNTYHLCWGKRPHPSRGLGRLHQRHCTDLRHTPQLSPRAQFDRQSRNHAPSNRGGWLRLHWNFHLANHAAPSQNRRR